VQVFRTVLLTDPDRCRSLLGAARAAKLAKDAPVADDACGRVVPQSGKFDTERP